MRQFKFATALLVAATLTACGGSDHTSKVNFSSQVSFGDSLSDVGTYAHRVIHKSKKLNEINDVTKKLSC